MSGPRRLPAWLAAWVALMLVGCGGAPDFSPSGSIPVVPAQFTWPAAAGVEEYELRIYRPDQTVLFESGRLRQPPFAVSDNLRELLTREGEFEWWIRGYERGRAAGRSEVVRVKIVP